MHAARLAWREMVEIAAHAVPDPRLAEALQRWWEAAKREKRPWQAAVDRAAVLDLWREERSIEEGGRQPYHMGEARPHAQVLVSRDRLQTTFADATPVFDRSYYGVHVFTFIHQAFDAPVDLKHC